MKLFQYCRKAEIYNGAGDLLCVADVTYEPKSGLLVTVPRSFKHLSQPSFALVFYDPVQGLVTCNCVFSAPLILPGGWRSLRCQVQEQLYRRQRRLDLKIPLECAVMVRLLPGSEDDPPPPETPCPATVHNLSAGGVYLTTRLNAAVGRRLAFSFHETGAPIPLVASILRVERDLSERDPALAGYGCRFTDMAAREESLLRGYIFQREREMHK